MKKLKTLMEKLFLIVHHYKQDLKQLIFMIHHFIQVYKTH